MKYNILSRLANWYQMKSMTPAQKALWEELFLAGAASGVTVTWRTALEFSVSLACARAIATGLMVPFKLFQTDGKQRVPASDDKRYFLLHNSPNDWQTGPDFFETIGYHLVFCGNAFVWKNIVDGRILELLIYEPGMVTVERDGWELRYKVMPDGGSPIEIPAEQMWHIRGPSWNAWSGMEGVKLARHVLGLGMAQQNYGSKFFKNNALPSGILSSEQAYPGPEKAAAMREAWQAAHGGDNAQGTATLWNGMKWYPLSVQNDNAQFLESRKFQVEEICRMFGVNPLIVFYSDKTSTYASAEQFFTQHVVHDLMPWYVRLEMSACKNLLTEKEWVGGKYFKFLANGLMRGSLKDRVAYYEGLSRIRAIKPNEVRELEEMNPYEGGDEFPVLQGQGAQPNAENGNSNNE